MPGPRRRSILVARLGLKSSGSLLDELRGAILDGEVPPGSPIPVDQVATAFGVSRIPNGGYRVAMMTAQEFSEFYLVREALETAALREAVALAGPDDDELARAAHRALDAAVVAHDARAHHRESRRFHLALIRPCRMRRLLHMLDSAWNMTEPLQPMSHLDNDGRESLHRDHAQMLEAFVARDADGLIAVFADHHHRLQSFVRGLPTDTGLFADP
jgi:DNA-binding GntR family transcriptional regulator